MQHNNHVSPSRAGSSGHGRSPAPRAVPGIPKRQVETIDEGGRGARTRRTRVCSIRAGSGSGLDTRRASSYNVGRGWCSACASSWVRSTRCDRRLAPTPLSTARLEHTRRASSKPPFRSSASSCSRCNRASPAAEAAPLVAVSTVGPSNIRSSSKCGMATAAHGRRSGDSAMSLPNIARRRAAFARVRRLAIVVEQQPVRQCQSSASRRHSRKSSPNPRRRTIPTW